MEKHIGYLVAGLQVKCLECGEEDWNNKTCNSQIARLFHINVFPYSQTCHCCGKKIVEPKTPSWCELFSKNINQAITHHL